MLSLIPAVLILILHGPAGVERMQVDGRLPEALRVWAGRQVGSQDALTQLLERRGCGELSALLSLGQDSSELSRFVAEVLKITASLPSETDNAGVLLAELPGSDLIPEPPPPHSGSGYCTSGRTRDGPSA